MTNISDMLPKQGTLERLLLQKMIDQPEGVTFLDFVGTGITEDNIDQLVQNLRNGMYESEEDCDRRYDA